MSDERCGNCGSSIQNGYAATECSECEATDFHGKINTTDMFWFVVIIPGYEKQDTPNLVLVEALSEQDAISIAMHKSATCNYGNGFSLRKPKVIRLGQCYYVATLSQLDAIDKDKLHKEVLEWCI